MNAKGLYQHANRVKAESSEHEDGNRRVECNISRNIEGELLPSQKSFIICESCFWCASLIYGVEEENTGVSHSLQCPNCYNGKIESLPLL